ncbi:MAG: peptide deformylase [Chlamydiota bacterium]
MRNESDPCPCGSGEVYKACCEPYHDGRLPENALKLMRSRYAAYALNLPKYLIQTTHPASPQFHSDIGRWAAMIADFCRHTQFTKLEVLSFQEQGSFAVVTFTAHLTQNKQDASFTERSYFEKIKGKWLYRSGLLADGHAPHLITTGQIKVLPLAYYGDPILRKVAEPITAFNDDLRTLVDEMIETMDAYDGVGLAAPQVHHSVQVFVIRVLKEEEGKVVPKGIKVMINPVIADPSAENWKIPEACLSIPTFQGEVERPQEITVEYSDVEGNRIQERISGWEARIVQHENDHLNGVLFIDRLSEEEKKAIKPSLEQLRKRIHESLQM